MSHATGTFGIYGELNSIVKHNILGLGKWASCAKTRGPILTIYTSRDLFLRKEVFDGL